MNVLVTFFIEKTRFLPIFLSSPKFGMRIYWWFFFVAKPRIFFFFFYTFLRISLQKINILKRAKSHPTNLDENYSNNKISTTQFNRYFKFATKNLKREKKRKYSKKFHT